MIIYGIYDEQYKDVYGNPDPFTTFSLTCANAKPLIGVRPRTGDTTWTDVSICT